MQLKTTKGIAITMLNVLDLWPKSEVKMTPSDNAKFVGCRRALKKALKKYLDTATGIRAESKKLGDELDDKYLNPLRLRLADDSLSEDQKAEVQRKLENKSKELEIAFLSPFNRKLNQLADGAENEKLEVAFDNEDFLYMSSFLKDNASKICTVSLPEQKNPAGVVIQIAQTRLDTETMEKIFDFIESETYNPKP